MSNLVERLRNQKYNAFIDEIYADSLEAADEIERLEGDKKWIASAAEAKAMKEKVEQLEAELRDAHFEGYMAGVGDSEDYDHDPIVMEKIAWNDLLHGKL